MIHDTTDPLTGFRLHLHDVYGHARRPTYRALESHAAQDGQTLRTSTVSDLLNGSSTPRWGTVQTFVRACAHYAQTHQVPLPAELTDLNHWHAAYQSMLTAVGLVVPRRSVAHRPAQLPAGAPFTGRMQHLAALDALLPAAGEAGPTVTICAIDGTAGVGKTALAVHWAHRVADLFPDGQLYANLRGFDAGAPLTPATVVGGFLDALRVPAHRVPATVDAQVSLYRSLVAQLRMLVVLDNARDTAQVRPLLPGGPGCLVVVTGRGQLTGLVAEHGAHPLTLDLLSAAEARALLAQRLGADRVAAEPAAVAEIVERCARLPLALALASARAQMPPGAGLRGLADQLADRDARTATLAGDDPATDLHTVFSWSVRTLSDPAARLFRLLGPYPGPTLTVPVAAGLSGLTPAEVRPLLAELRRAGLVTEPAAGRYAMHDLLRDHAARLDDRVSTSDRRWPSS